MDDLRVTASAEAGDDPERLTELLSACELARQSYEAVLDAGVDRSDMSLARDRRYGDLLSAGQKIRKLGGDVAVEAASRHLARCVHGGRKEHFRRLWDGLLSHPH